MHPPFPSSRPHRNRTSHKGVPRSLAIADRWTLPGTLYHIPQDFRVLQHGAGAQHILIERLAVMVGHKEGAFQRVQQTAIVDVHIGIVDEHTRLHITSGVDMQIVSAPGDTAAHILGIILEVHAEDRLSLPETAHPLIDGI